MQDAINVEVGGELVIFHNIFSSGGALCIKMYQYISLYIDLLHYICEHRLDNFTFLHYPSKGEGVECYLLSSLVLSGETLYIPKSSLIECSSVARCLTAVVEGPVTIESKGA